MLKTIVLLFFNLFLIYGASLYVFESNIISVLKKTEIESIESLTFEEYEFVDNNGHKYDIYRTKFFTDTDINNF